MVIDSARVGSGPDSATPNERIVVKQCGELTGYDALEASVRVSQYAPIMKHMESGCVVLLILRT